MVLLMSRTLVGIVVNVTSKLNIRGCLDSFVFILALIRIESVGDAESSLFFLSHIVLGLQMRWRILHLNGFGGLRWGWQLGYRVMVILNRSWSYNFGGSLNSNWLRCWGRRWCRSRRRNWCRRWNWCRSRSWRGSRSWYGRWSKFLGLLV